MKNMVKLAGYRKIFDLITAWTEDAAPNVYVSFEVDGNKVLIILSSARSNEPIDAEAVDKIEELFLDGCALVDSDVDTRIYEIGDTDCLFRVTTIELLEYATDEGFVISEYEYGHIDGDRMIDFILDNPNFTIKAVADEDGKEVIIS